MHSSPTSRAIHAILCACVLTLQIDANADVTSISGSIITPGGLEQSSWSVDPQGMLRKDASRGRGPVAIALSTFDTGRVHSAGANPFDGGAWVAGSSRVLVFGPDGKVLSSKVVPAAGRSARFAADETIWIREDSALRGVSVRGGSDRLVPLPKVVLGAIDDWEVDAVRGVVWMAAATKLVKIDLEGPSEPRVTEVPSSVRSIAYDQSTGHVWALLVDRVMSFDSKGFVRVARTLSQLRLDSPDLVRFSDDLGALMVRDVGKAKAIPRDGSMSIEVSKGWTLPKATTAVLPSVQMERQVEATPLGEVIRLNLAARCGGKQCDLGTEWISRYRIEARMGRQSISDVAIDPAGRTALLRLPAGTTPSRQSVVVQLVDAFGHRSPPVSRWFQVASQKQSKAPGAPLPTRGKSGESFCVPTPSLDSSNTFVPFASPERLEVRSGRFGAADWEWGLGTNTQQAGKFVTANLNWVNGRAYRFVLAYDGSGNGSMQVLDGSAQVFAQSFTGPAGEPLRAGNAVKLYVKSSAGIGAGNRVSVAVNEINGVPASASVATAGSGDFSESALVFALNSRQGFELRGTVSMDFTGSYPPTGSRLNMMVNAGNVQCPTANQPPTLFFVSPGDGNVLYSPAQVGIEVYAEDPEGAIAGLGISSPGPDGFTLDAGPVSRATYDWNGVLVGNYTITAIVTDAAGATASQSVSIQVVPDPIDQPVLDAWNGMRDAVNAGNQAAALEFLTPAARERYGRVLADLQSDAGLSLEALTAPVRVLLGEDFAEYVVMRGSGAARQAFFVNFLRGEDGLWRIEDL